MSLPDLHSIAAVAAERLLFSLGVGTLLAIVVWLLLRVFPRKDSRTSFAVWFATLVITAVLPVASLFLSHAGRGSGRSAAVITISAAWTMYIFIGWASLALLGLARVGVALWQVQRLRRESTPLDLVRLGPGVREVVEQFKLNPTLCGRSPHRERVRHGEPQRMGHLNSVCGSRSVALKVSKRLEVPTAIGFLKPAIVLPEWLLRETPAEELKYILLHELAHLRRRDDWTNLAQEMVKALLFFVPSVWWIERKLALDREMACDDAVLAHSGTPRGYAECLARVAERSFLRRQLALAQAAVTRLRQLTVRVTKILDPNRPQPVKMWKPAVPAVMVVAGLCVFSASQGPQLIGFGDSAPQPAQTLAVGSLVQSSVGARAIRPAVIPASLKTREPEQESKPRAWNAAYKMSSAAQQRSHERKPVTYALTNLHAENKIERGPVALARLEKPETEYVTVRQELMIVVTQRGEMTPQSWQVQVVEISVTKAKQKQVPKKI